MQQPATNPTGQELVGSHELREITELLVRHHGLHEGLYDLAIEFQIAAGAVGIDPSAIVPGAVFGVRRIGIMKTVTPGISTVDAAEINPLVQQRKSRLKRLLVSNCDGRTLRTVTVATLPFPSAQIYILGRVFRKQGPSNSLPFIYPIVISM